MLADCGQSRRKPRIAGVGFVKNMRKYKDSDYITKACEQCGVEIHALRWEVARGKGKYCGAACRNIANPPKGIPFGVRERNPNFVDGNPDKAKKDSTRHATRRAVLAGILVRPSQCSKCDSPRGRIEAHHHDYNYPLDVTWLCQECHRREHRAALAA